MFNGKKAKKRSTLEISKVPLKCYFILREDLQYSSDRLFHIGVKTISEDFFNMHVKDIKEQWVQDGSKFETYMMFNIGFIYKLEEVFINIGIIHKWIYNNNVPVGLFIEPTRINIRSNLVNDCMTLEEYAKHRLEQFNELKAERKNIEDFK